MLQRAIKEMRIKIKWENEQQATVGERAQHAAHQSLVH